jgi:uncharacterized membrane protein YeiH
MSLIAMAASATTATVAATSAVAATSPLDLGSVIVTTVPSMLASALPSGVTTTAPVTAVAVQVPAAFEVSAAFAGALAGALVAVRLRFDLVGIATLAVVSGLGGGIIRDVLLQKHGIYALENPRVLIAALVAALVGFFFFSLAERLKWAIFLIDAVALGIFAAIGSDKALLAGLTVIPAVLLGTITAVGGGVLRDVLTDDVPQVLRPGSFYATVAVAGAAFYVALVAWLNVVKPVALIATLAVVVGLRLLTYWLGWQTPTATDLTPLVAAAPRRVAQSGGRAIGWAKGRTRAWRSDDEPGPPDDTTPDDAPPSDDG